MSTITLRSTKGSPLTNTEVDNNFTNLNNDKYQSGDSASFSGLAVDGAYPEITLNDTRNINSWNDGDVLGQITFTTNDATMSDPIAAIKAVHNRAGTGHSANDAGLEFYTSAATTGTVAKRMEIEATTGDISFYDTTGTNASFVYDASTQLVVNEDSRDFDFRVESDASSHALFVDAGNNSVGVGTSNPSGQMEVHSPTGTVTKFYVSQKKTYGAGYGTAESAQLVLSIRENNTASDREFAAMRAYTNSESSSADGILYLDVRRNGALVPRQTFTPTETVFNDTSADVDFRVESDNHSHMLFVDGGNDAVLVNYNGTPNSKLDVCLTPVTTDSSMNAGNSNTLLTLRAPYGISPASVSNAGAEWGLRMLGQTDGNASGKSVGIFAVSEEDASHGYNRKVGMALKTSAFDAAEATRMYIDGTGNIGIGTSSPQHHLTVYGNSGTASGQYGSPATLALTNESGASEVGGTIIFAADNPGGGAQFYGASICYNNVNSSSLGSIGNLEFLTKPNRSDTTLLKRMVIGPNGSITHSAGDSTSFVVNDGSADCDFRVESNDNTHMLFVDGGNNRVGIGTSEPSQTLDVTGTIRAPGVMSGNSYSTRSVTGPYFTQGTSGQAYDILLGNESISGYLELVTTGGYSGENTIGVIKQCWYFGLNPNNWIWASPVLVSEYVAGIIRDRIYVGSPYWNSTESQYAIRVYHKTSNGNDYNHSITATSNTAASRLINNVTVGDLLSDTTTSYHTSYSDYTFGTDHRFGNSTDYVRFNMSSSNAQIELIDNNQVDPPTIMGNGPYMIFKNGGHERLRLNNASSGAIFNDIGGDYDFRVESDNYTHALFVNGAGGQIAFTKSDASENVTSGHGWGWHPGGGAGFQSIVQTADSGNGCMYLNKRIRSSSGTNTLIQFMLNDGSSTNYYVGNITGTSSGTTYNTTSDRRLKDNIETITDGTDKLMAMNPVTHTWKADPDAPAVHGFIAQEMQDVIPEAVSGEDGGEEMMSMDYGRITPVIVAALQDAHREIKNLKAEIAALKGDK